MLAMKCCGKGCKNEGIPDPGFEFFVCSACDALFAFWLNLLWSQDHKNPANRGAAN
jgi:hypothetical protein